MLRAGYNSAIPYSILRSVDRRSATAVRGFWFVIFFLTVACLSAWAADWSGVEQQLAHKIVAVTGPGTVALSVENRSSLSRRDSDIVQNGLRAALEQSGIHFVKAEQAAASVTISLSENSTSYVWVAEIHQSATESAVAMVSVPRSGRLTAVGDSMPITLHKTLLWSQDDRIFDVAVLEENGAPTRIAVLSAENVSLYRWQGSKWQPEQVLGITHTKPWPLDLRGRLIPSKDHFVDAYLPGVICRGNGSGGTLAMNCRESDDPWPLIPAAMSAASSVFPGGGSSSTAPATISPLAAFFAPTRNFFTGVVTPPVGKINTVPKFYSAAFVPRERYTLWFFAATDGKVHMVDGMSDQASRLEWGSDITTVKTNCGAGWQVLAVSAGDEAGDSFKAYEFPDRDPVAVSPAIELPGGVSALWTEARGDSAVAIVNNRETGSYEAYRLAVACTQ